MSQDTRNYWIDNFGDEVTAKKKFGQLFFLHNLTHEEVHQYQSKSLPNLFSEGGAHYYQRELKAKLGFGYVANELTEIQNRAYRILIDVYGDDVHRVYFGQKMDCRKREEILAAALTFEEELLKAKSRM